MSNIWKKQQQKKQTKKNNNGFSEKTPNKITKAKICNFEIIKAISFTLINVRWFKAVIIRYAITIFIAQTVMDNIKF